MRKVTSGFGYSMTYDNNGNVRTRTGNNETWAFRWSGFDQPRWIGKRGGDPYDTGAGSAFIYGPDHQRVVHLEFNSMTQDGAPVNWTPVHFTTKKVYVSGGGMELDYKNTNPTGETWQLDTARVYIPAPGGNAGAAELKPAATEYSEHRFVLYYCDHLGSIQAVAEYGSDPWAALPAWDRPKTKRTLYSYDAWGQRRDPTDWLGGVGGQSTYTYGGSNDITPRGYTGHEMLDNLSLVHMNGRIYDPKLGRFLSDPIIQAPGNLQNYNRYSYVLNNPLRYTDPSGYSVDGKDENKPKRKPVYVPFQEIFEYLTELKLNPIRYAEQHHATPGKRSFLRSRSRVAAAGQFINSNAESKSEAAAAVVDAVTDDAVQSTPAEDALDNETHTTGSDGGEANPQPSAGRKGEASSGSGFGNVLRKIPLLGGILGRLGDIISGAASITKGNLTGGLSTIGHGIGSATMGALDLTGKVWNLPNTAIGIAWGAVGLSAEIVACPFTRKWDFGISIGNNAIQFTGHSLMFGAITLGNTISYASNFGPAFQLPGGTVGDHERQHTYQGQILGVLYLPSNILGIFAGLVFNGDSHGAANWNEIGPLSSPPKFGSN